MEHKEIDVQLFINPSAYFEGWCMFSKSIRDDSVHGHEMLQKVEIVYLLDKRCSMYVYKQILLYI
jgi:hypothetical protein